MNDNATHCYIASNPPCGCIRWVSVDQPQYAKENGKNTANMIQAGYQVSRVRIDEFKAGTHGQFGCKDTACPKHPDDKKRTKRAELSL